jgi:hypothetical protein
LDTDENATPAISPTIIDAAGDLIIGTAADTVGRLAIGTAGQLLQVNSGATAPEWISFSSGAMTEITSGTLSGASVSLTSIPGTYKNLQLVIRNYLPANDDATISLRINNDTGGNYNRILSSAATQTDVSVSGTNIGISAPQDNAVTQQFAIVTFYDYANAVTWKSLHGYSLNNNATNTGNINTIRYHGWYLSTSAITRLDLFPSTGNFTSGDYILYGVK